MSWLQLYLSHISELILYQWYNNRIQFNSLYVFHYHVIVILNDYVIRDLRSTIDPKLDSNLKCEKHECIWEMLHFLVLRSGIWIISNYIFIDYFHLCFRHICPITPLFASVSIWMKSVSTIHRYKYGPIPKARNEPVELKMRLFTISTSILIAWYLLLNKCMNRWSYVMKFTLKCFRKIVYILSYMSNL